MPGARTPRFAKGRAWPRNAAMQTEPLLWSRGAAALPMARNRRARPIGGSRSILEFVGNVSTEGDKRISEEPAPEARPGGGPAGTPRDARPGPGMPVADLDLPAEAISLLEGMHNTLNAMQADSVRAGLLEGRSVLVSAPTSGGKTLVALMATLACLHRRAGRAVYLCPMRSLAAEKYGELKALESIELNGRAPRVARSTGDHGASGGALGAADVVVMTNERLDSLMRHDGRWRRGIGLVVVDEVHLVGDAVRGPALETIVAHAKSMDSPPQLVGLSATAPNAKELAGWLGARLVQSYERPVPLREGVYDGETLSMSDGEVLHVERGGGYGDAVHVGLASALAGHKTLVFADSKRNAVSMAREAAGAIGGRLPRGDRESLRGLSARILGSPEPTKATRDLASMVSDGVAFHHSGLAQECREAVEEGFRAGPLWLVVSTPTLAVGVNLPARRVVVSSLTIYDQDAKKRVPISVRAYKQMAGRAGRPQYDDAGEAVIVAGSQGAAHAWSHYVGGRPERVVSRMADGDSLLAHLLGLVVMRPGIAEGRIAEFFLMTLAAAQEGEEKIRQHVKDGLCFLRSNGLVSLRRTGVPALFAPSRLGELASRLYIGPQVALDFQRVARAKTADSAHALGIIYAAITFGGTGTYVRKDDKKPISELAAEHSDELFVAIRDANRDVERSALALWRWIDGAPAGQIADRLDIEPGTMDAIAHNVGRLVRCIAAISRLENNAGLAVEAEELAARIEHGVRPEMLDLVGLRHVGRANAGKLHAAGYGTRASLQALSAQELAKIIPVGKRRAGEILAQASVG